MLVFKLNQEFGGFIGVYENLIFSRWGGGGVNIIITRFEYLDLFYVLVLLLYFYFDFNFAFYFQISVLFRN